MTVHDQDNTPQNEEEQPGSPPGHFVTGELKDQCARFLDEVKDLVSRRRSREAPPR